MNIFTKHPNSIGETYLQHAFIALRYSFVFLLLFLMTVVHAIFPFFFERTASDIVDELSKHMLKRRKEINS